MALQMTINKQVFGQEVTIEKAYHRVENIEGNKNGIVFVMATYTQDILHQVESKVYRFAPSDTEDALRWDKQCYEYIKSTDEFSEAIDI